MSSPWGVQPSGFVRKPISAIVQSLNDGVQGTVNSQADVSSSSPLGKWHIIFASALDEVWGLAQTGYNGFDRDAAVGAQQDSLGAITGSLRLAAKPSSVYTTAVFSASGTYGIGSLVANLNGVPSSQFSNAQTVVIPVTNPPVSLSNLYTVPSPGVLFTSIEDGPIPAPAGQLTQISVSVPGWISLTNPTDATLGNYVEADAAFEVRQEEEIAAVGASQIDAITAALLEVPHVIFPRVLENTGLSPDPVTGMPAKSFQCLIYADPSIDWTKVSQVIWNEKPGGMQAYGAMFPGNAPTPFSQLDALGNDVSVRVQWTPVTSVQVILHYQVTFSPGLTGPGKVAIANQLALALVNLSQGFDPNLNTLPIGTPGVMLPGGAPGLLPTATPTYVISGFVYALPYIRAALNTPGIVDVVSFAFASPGPVPTLSPVDITTIGINQIGFLSSAPGGIQIADANGVIWHA